MDEHKLRTAIAMLQAIAEKLRDGDVEEKYIDLYNTTLADIQDQLVEFGCDLSPFFIPNSELDHHVTSFRSGPRLPSQRGTPDVTYSKERFCDGDRFQIALAGAINLINGYLQTPPPAKPKIGF
jgi:hypothetical protein